MNVLKNLTVLYVEDEKEILEKYAYFFKEYCKTLYLASDGEEAYELFIEHKPQLIIMDLQIPKMNGMKLARKIREESEHTIMIALTAHSDREILLDIIDLNFSSYLIKPVGRTDLIQSLLKVAEKINRGKDIPLPYDCLWDDKSKTLFCKDKSIVLTRRETKFFELLVEKNGAACGDDEICFYVWGDDFDKTITNSSIRTLVKNLRKKIPKDLIKNQYGVGYRINF